MVKYNLGAKPPHPNSFHVFKGNHNKSEKYCYHTICVKKKKMCSKVSAWLKLLVNMKQCHVKQWFAYVYKMSLIII